MNGQRGFTLGELLAIAVLLSIIFVLILIAGPPFGGHYDKAKGAEVKANVRMIEIALERYATDHDVTYPRYIWGGDKEGWDAYFKEGPRPGTETAIYDPLIRYGYLESYPRNPFVRDGKSVIDKTSAFKKDGSRDWLGTGDPRFGYSGTLMGNGLSDPRYPECDDTLGGALDGEWGEGVTLDIEYKPGHTWTMGGWWDSKKRKTISTHWPGCFFYRSAVERMPDVVSMSTADIASHRQSNSADWTGDAALIVKLSEPDTYIIGGYGEADKPGYDVIRMGDFETGEGGLAFSGARDSDPIRYYRMTNDPGKGNPEFPIMFPEVFGKGEHLKFPAWPYRKSVQQPFLYGSPDGSPDGVIITLVKSHPREKAPSPEEMEQERLRIEKWKLEHGKGPEQIDY